MSNSLSLVVALLAFRIGLISPRSMVESYYRSALDVPQRESFRPMVLPSAQNPIQYMVRKFPTLPTISCV